MRMILRVTTETSPGMILQVRNMKCSTQYTNNLNVFYRRVNPSDVVEKLEGGIRNFPWSWFDHISRRNLKFLTWWVVLDRILIAKLHTLPETNSLHLKRFHQRKLVFQPSIFRCYVSLRECNCCGIGTSRATVIYPLLMLGSSIWKVYR